MNREHYRLSVMCRVYNVSREGYYAWKRRGKSKRKLEDEVLLAQIRILFNRHDGCYGSPKITRTLRKQGIPVGQKRVARIMREHGFKAKKARIYTSRPGTYRFTRACPNRIVNLQPTAPNQLWVGDVTYLKLEDGSWQYLSVIMDRFSRRIIGWSLSAFRDAELTATTLKHAIRKRGCHQHLLFHSDRGTEYLAKKFRKRLANYGIEQSMNRVHQMNDNAFMESFFHQFKTERIKTKVLKSADHLRSIIIEYIRYYNFDRMHTSIGDLSPAEFEAQSGLNE